MLSTNLSDFRKDMKHYIDKVIDSNDILIINRRKDKGVVIMSLDEYNSIEATMHEFKSRKNIERLFEAMDQLERGEKLYKDLIEV